jgi:hypothetical protein
MGKQYEEPFKRLLRKLEQPQLSVYINPSGLNPKYRDHIAQTLADFGATRVDRAEDADLVVRGYVTRVHDQAVGLDLYSVARGSIILFPEERHLAIVG